MPNVSYLYELQGADYTTLSAQNFRVSVVDTDDAHLSAQQITALQQQGKTMFSYLSIGEAEDYRSYWTNGNWDAHPPSFLLAENPEWEGNYAVKFWDAGWQQIMINQITGLARAGYNGAYLDIVDAYQRPEIIAAYHGANIRLDMENFVIRLSQAAKAINPEFKIIPQNAVELLALPGTMSSANVRYLAAIDGVGKEDTFYNDNQPTTWGTGDVAYLANAIAAGKFVLAIDYPTDPALQADFINRALAAGYIPYVGNRDLDEHIPGINGTISGRLGEHAFDQFIALRVVGTGNAENMNGGLGHDSFTALGGNDTVNGMDGNDTLRGGDGNDQLSGWTGNDSLTGEAGNDVLYGQAGNDRLTGGLGNDHLLGQAGDDSVVGDAGLDTLRGAQGNDTILGGDDNDLVIGGDDQDVIYGQFGDDTIYGDYADGTGTGQDTLYGQMGNDVLYGGAGNDQLTGGVGNDTLAGGAGNDTYYFLAGSGVDRIQGFDLPGAGVGDHIAIASNVNGSGIVSAQTALAHVSYSGGNALLDLGGGNVVVIENIAPGSLSTEDFVIF